MPPPIALSLRFGGEEEPERKHGRLNLKENGGKKEKKKTQPDVSPHGPSPVAAEGRPKRSRNVNKEINAATMTVFWGVGWGGVSVYRATAVTGKPAALSMERQVKKRQEWDGNTSQEERSVNKKTTKH